MDYVVHIDELYDSIVRKANWILQNIELFRVWFGSNSCVNFCKCIFIIKVLNIIFRSSFGYALAIACAVWSTASVSKTFDTVLI